MWEWFKRRFCGTGSQMTVEETRQDRRSRVRVQVTYWAALYIFGGSVALIILALYGKLNADNFDVVREIFTMILPIATGVVTYWFATRQQPGTLATERPSQISETQQTTVAGQQEEPGKQDSQS